jgi:alkylation response protein AidB-like acyl-CoA dehydrogenase
MRDILHDSASRIFAGRFDDAAIRLSRTGTVHAKGWSAIAEAGLPLALVREADGGFGVAAAPLGETMVANALLTRAGLPPAAGMASFAALTDGEAADVPWAVPGATLVVLDNDRLCAVPAEQCALTPVKSLSGLPRATVRVSAAGPSVDAPPGVDAGWLRRAGAIIRTQEMAGALAAVLAMTVRYAGEREQFGKPIGRQQAIQHNLALIATQAAAAGAAAAIAASAWDADLAPLAVAAAKARASEAAGIAAGLAHQIHGAIGFTREFPLQLFTRALWQWRDYYGSEHYWAAVLGGAALAGGKAGYWPFVTGLAA